MMSSAHDGGLEWLRDSGEEGGPSGLLLKNPGLVLMSAGPGGLAASVAAAASFSSSSISFTRSCSSWEETRLKGTGSGRLLFFLLGFSSISFELELQGAGE